MVHRTSRAKGEPKMDEHLWLPQQGPGFNKIWELVRDKVLDWLLGI